MSLAPEKLSAFRGVSVFLLALVLLLSPVCGALCQAQMCDTPQAGAQNSSCHESVHSTADSSNGHVSSIQNCALQQQPVALPVGFRWVAGCSPLVDDFTYGPSPFALQVANVHHDNQLHLQFSSCAESRSLSGLPEHSSRVLRI